MGVEERIEMAANSSTNMDQTAFNLLSVFSEPGCPVCRLVKQGVASYLDNVSYELVNDIDTRTEIRRALGYCAAHGQEWLGLRDTLGTALIYRDVLIGALEILQSQVAPTDTAGGLVGRLQGLLGNAPAGTEIGRALSASLRPQGPCPVCALTLKLERETAASFARALANRAFLEGYTQRQPTMCLPHLRQVLELISEPSLVTVFTQVQEACLSVTCEQLAEVIRKHDYRFTQEARGAEFEAPARSVAQAAGSLSTQVKLPER